jgi:heptosyltransferase-2
MKILVRGTNWIGDAVMSVPALRELRRIFPDDHITLHTRTWADGLFQDATFIDELVTYDPHRWKIKDAIDNSDFLKADGFELAVLLPNSFESALTTFLTRIPRRVGYNKDLRGLLLTDPVPVPEWKSRRHEVYYYLNLISEVERRVLGRQTVAEAFADGTIEVSDDRKNAAREFLSSHGVDSRRTVVGLGPGSTNSIAKRWPAERFAALGDRLTEALECTIVLLGGPDEKNIGREVADLSENNIVDLIGRTTLDQAVALLSVVELMVSNDMGLAHVAPAVGTRTVAIFGPTDPETTRPFGENAIVVQSDSNEPWPTVDRVFDAALGQLQAAEAQV